MNLKSTAPFINTFSQKGFYKKHFRKGPYTGIMKFDKQTNQPVSSYYRERNGRIVYDTFENGLIAERIVSKPNGKREFFVKDPNRENNYLIRKILEFYNEKNAIKWTLAIFDNAGQQTGSAIKWKKGEAVCSVLPHKVKPKLTMKELKQRKQDELAALRAQYEAELAAK